MRQTKEISGRQRADEKLKRQGHTTHCVAWPGSVANKRTRIGANRMRQHAEGLDCLSGMNGKGYVDHQGPTNKAELPAPGTNSSTYIQYSDQLALACQETDIPPAQVWLHFYPDPESRALAWFSSKTLSTSAAFGRRVRTGRKPGGKAGSLSCWRQSNRNRLAWRRATNAWLGEQCPITALHTPRTIAHPPSSITNLTHLGSAHPLAAHSASHTIDTGSNDSNLLTANWQLRNEKEGYGGRSRRVIIPPTCQAKGGGGYTNSSRCRPTKEEMRCPCKLGGGGL